LSGIDDVFNALFFGAGSWLGLLLFISIIIGLLYKTKYSGALLLPIAVFLGISYLDASLPWHAVIMLFTSIFIIVYMAKGKD
jgi:predicted membrane-bound dolichyl-phosphate-mannose-protein mannosyltransferase